MCVGVGSYSGVHDIGNCMVSFGDVEGYYSPKPLEVSIEANKAKSVAGVYKPKPKGKICIKTTSDRGDVDGDIYVDGDYIGVGSCTVERTIGAHTVSYGDMKGYEKPSSKSIDVKERDMINVVGRYNYIPPELVPPKAVILSPKDGATVYSDEWIVLSGKGDDSDGVVSEYMWGVDGLVIGHGKDLRYKFRDIGTHTVTLAVVDNDGLSDEYSAKIYVDVKPSITLSIAPDVLRTTSEKARLRIAIKTLLPNPSTIVEIHTIQTTQGVERKEDDERAILTSLEVMSGKPEIRTISVGASEMGKYSIKLIGYYWLADDPGNPKGIESNEVNFRVAGGGHTTSKPEPYGFENMKLFALIALVVIYLVRRRKRKRRRTS